MRLCNAFKRFVSEQANAFQIIFNQKARVYSYGFAFAHCAIILLLSVVVHDAKKVCHQPYLPICG